MAKQERGHHGGSNVRKDVGGRYKVGDVQNNLLSRGAVSRLAPGGRDGLALEDGNGPRDLPDDPAQRKEAPEDVSVYLPRVFGNAEQRPDNAGLDEGTVQHVEELPDNRPQSDLVHHADGDNIIVGPDSSVCKHDDGRIMSEVDDLRESFSDVDFPSRDS